MRRIVAGATGLIGERLVEHWIGKKHDVTVIGRSLERIREKFGARVNGVTWTQLGPQTLNDVDVVVNLAGANIGIKRWTDAYKKEIIESRIHPASQFAKLLQPLGDKAPLFFNASAVGIYGAQAEVVNGLPEAFDEQATLDQGQSGFLSQLARQWEAATKPASDQGVRVVLLRFGVVLAREGGALPMLVRPFRYFLGGAMGTGNQPFPWIEIDDAIRAIDFIITEPNASGPYNVVAPQGITQHDLAEAIANAMNKPALVTMPKFILKYMFGEEKSRELLLQGQHVYPRRLVEAGFVFQYPHIQSALNHLL